MAETEVSIILKAVDKVSGVMAGINKSIEKVNQSPLGKITQELTGFNLASLAGAAGIATAAKQIYQFSKESIDVTVKLGNEVEELTRITGDSEEATSRLIQASDDMRLSEDALKASLLAASRQGIDVSTASLMKMADQYNKLRPGLEQTNFLTKTFGRNGAEMARILELGSAGLKAKMDATSDSIVMDREAVEATKEYQASLDALNDSVDGVKNSIGKELIPYTSDFNLVLSTTIDGLSKGTSTLSDIQRVMSGIQSFGLSELIRGGISGSADSIREAEAAIAAAGNAANVASDRFDKMDSAIENSGAASLDAAGAMQKYTTQLLYQIASEGLSAEAALDLANKMGLVDQSTVTATQKTFEYKQMLDEGKISLSEYNALVAGLSQYLDSLNDKDVRVHLVYDVTGDPGNFEGYKPKAGATETPHALGGAVQAGVPYLVGEYGPEPFIPNQNGQIIPAGQSQPKQSDSIFSQANMSQFASIISVAVSTAIQKAMA